MNEKFSIKKLLDFSPVGFYKVIGLSIKVGVIILIILGLLWVKNLLLPQKASVKEITVGDGGKVFINDNKRRIEPFLFGWGSTGTDGDQRVGLGGGFKW